MPDRFKLVITDFVNDDLGPERRLVGDIADIVACDAHDERELAGRIEDAHAVMLYHNLALSRRTIERMARCRLIVRCGVGIDNVDHAFARQRGIAVANVPDYGTGEVADSAIGMALALARGIHLFNSRLRAGQRPWMYTQAVPLLRLQGRVFAIVGLGRIGTATAVRAKALGMDVVFYDPFKQDGYDKALGIRRAPTIRHLCSEAYILSLHCPLTDHTHHIINHQSLSWMPKGSYLVNTARGAVVDTRALPQALADGQLAGAAIDVLDGEPPAADDPLLVAWRDPRHPAHDRLILNPHAAFYCEEGFGEMRTKGALACRAALLGQPVPNVVN